jgi:hypothetical protein
MNDNDPRDLEDMQDYLVSVLPRLAQDTTIL